MKTVEIEWRRLVKDGATCERCGDTGVVLRRLVERLNTECRPRGVAIVLKAGCPGRRAHRRIESDPDRWKLLEQLQPRIVVGQNDCPSCGEAARP